MDLVISQSLVIADKSKADCQAAQIPGERTDIGFVEVDHVEEQPTCRVEVSTEIVHVKIAVDPDAARSVFEEWIVVGGKIRVKQHRTTAVEGMGGGRLPESKRSYPLGTARFDGGSDPQENLLLLQAA